MIKSVARQYYWDVETIGKLFVDSIDYKGLEFWYLDAKEISESLKKKT